MPRGRVELSELPQIHLARHGETEWSRAGRHTGRTDLPLTPAGEVEAIQLGSRLAGLAPRVVLSSPLVRARRTCELAGFGTMMQIDPDLAEWDYGEYEGLRSAEIRARQPEWNVFRHGCPGGEDPLTVAARADRLIARLRREPGDALLFSHGHFLRMFAARWIGLSPENARPFLLGTAAHSILGYEHGRQDEPVVRLWNVTSP